MVCLSTRFHEPGRLIAVSRARRLEYEQGKGRCCSTVKDEVVSYCYAYLVLSFFFQVQHQFGGGPIFKAEVYSDLVKLADVLRGKVYCSHDYQGLIYMSIV